MLSRAAFESRASPDLNRTENRTGGIVPCRPHQYGGEARQTQLPVS